MLEGEKIHTQQQIGECKRWTFEEILNDFIDEILRFLIRKLGNHQDAEEVVHDVFIAFHETYYVGQGRQQWTFEDLRRLLYKIASNRSKNFIRDKNAIKRRGQTIPLEEILLDQIPKVNHEDTDILRQDVHQAINQLPDVQRHIVDLHIFCGYTLRQVAEILDLRADQVKGRWKQAQDKLRDRLSDYHNYL